MKKIIRSFEGLNNYLIIITLILCIYILKNGKYISKIVTQDYIDDIIFELALITNLHRIVF